MSTAQLPTPIGLSWNVVKTPIWSTKVQIAASGRELRAAYYSYPLWKFSLSYELLRAAVAYAELQAMLAFFNARQGKFDTFLYTDPTDNAVVSNNFGTGNGSTVTFQLTRTLSGWAEPVPAPVTAGIAIYVNGVLKTQGTDYTINASTGVVTFTPAPGAGLPLTWTGSFYFRCRFLQDSADFNNFMRDLFELRKLEFQSVKP